ncbi:MAG TPA: hypothetical protein VGL83_16745 [Stellaceae bacterium]|jgi:hypothetical protein
MTETTQALKASNPGDQWRVDNARHLAGAKLHKCHYKRYSDPWDHDHCAACMTKFAEFDAPDVQHVGYATGDDYKFGANYEWVCPQCFAELKPVLGWTADEGAP